MIERPRRGRPRKWVDEAERSRAYRARRAEELADPERLRQLVRQFRSDAIAARRSTQTAERRLDRAGEQVDALGRKLAKARQELQASDRRARTACADRDRAERLLRSKMRWAGDATGLRGDADALIALVAELRLALAQCEHELNTALATLNKYGLLVPGYLDGNLRGDP